MIYRSGVFSKREGLSDSEFREHWLNVHGPLARQMPGLHSYRQNHIKERIFEAKNSQHHAIDGISQLMFDDIAAMERSEVSIEYAACKADIPKFQSAITILVLESEQACRGGQISSSDGVKLLWLSVARSEVAGETLRQQWKADLTAKVDAIPSGARWIQNFVVDRAHPVQAGVPQGDIDAETLSELWFSNYTALKQWVDSPSGHQLIHGDPLFAPLGVYVVEEVRIL